METQPRKSVLSSAALLTAGAMLQWFLERPK